MDWIAGDSLNLDTCLEHKLVLFHKVYTSSSQRCA